MLFVFGAYVGSIADVIWYVAGIRMGLAGVVVAITLLLPEGCGMNRRRRARGGEAGVG